MTVHGLMSSVAENPRFLMSMSVTFGYRCLVSPFKFIASKLCLDLGLSEDEVLASDERGKCIPRLTVRADVQITGSRPSYWILCHLKIEHIDKN